MRPGAGDDHPHDVVIELVAFPGFAVVGQESAKQVGEHHHLLRIPGSFVSIQHHLQLLGLRPKISLTPLGVLCVPGATILFPVKGLGVGVKQRVCVRWRDCLGRQCPATHSEAENGNPDSTNPQRRLNRLDLL